MNIDNKWHRGHIDPFWDDESFYCLTYSNQKFSNDQEIERWKQEGYVHPEKYFTGAMCDMSNPQPDWGQKIIKWFQKTYPVKNVGITYYKMVTGVISPRQNDEYIKYRKLFDIPLEKCVRVIVFLQDWKSGHYFEINDTPITDWRAGDYVFWKSDTPHMAANIGTTERYTLQWTAHIL